MRALRTLLWDARSIRVKLIAIIMLVCAGAIIVASLGVLGYQYLALREEMVRDLGLQAEVLAAGSSAAVAFDDPQDGEEILSALRVRPEIEMAATLRNDGSVLASYVRDGAVLEIAHISSGNHKFGSNSLLATRPIQLDGARIGTILLRVDLRHIKETLTSSALTFAFAASAILVLAFFLARVLQGAVSAPIAALTETTDAVRRGGDYTLRATVMSRDELGRLTESFNEMLAQIQRGDRELRRLRNYLSNIIDSMPSLLVGVDKDGSVTQWNREAERVTGLKSMHAIGRPLGEVMPRFQSEMQHVHEAIASRQKLTDSRRTHGASGDGRYEDVTVYPLTANGVEGAVIRVDDVSDRVRLEEMMVQSEKMMSVGGLAAGMAHEINNPLAGMMQTAYVVESRLCDDLPVNVRAAEAAGTDMTAIRAFVEARDIQKMLGRIQESGERAAQIVANMLSFARKSTDAASKCSVADILDESVELASIDYDLKKSFDFRQIDIIREYADGIPEVPCEGPKLQQVVMNILRNGAEAMQDGSHEMHHRKPAFVLRLAHDAAADMVRIEISDNGPGMDPAVCRRIFEPFFTTKPIDQGTGLGLSVSYFIVTEVHRGRMRVESTPGKGTSFVVELPCSARHSLGDD